MSQVLVAFGIDWRLLLIDSINFGLLLLVLWYFLYTPLLRMLEARRNKVAQGVLDADQAQNTLHEIEASRGEVLAAAGAEADEVLRAARSSALARQREIVADGEAAAAAAVREAQAQAKELQVEALEQSKKEVAKLVVLGVEKMLTQKTS